VRITVVGTSGSGKTTLARRLAAEFALPHVEVDAINWQPGWRALVDTDRAEFIRRVDAATSGDAWVTDGNYGALRLLVWSRSTHLVWLDYSRPVIMARVIRRSVWRALDRRELWPGTGNREDWRKWLHASHPIRWAWDTWQRRRKENQTLLADPRFAHLTVLHLTRPREAKDVVASLRQSLPQPSAPSAASPR
jgi:adenylate kinase family enzyme